MTGLTPSVLIVDDEELQESTVTLLSRKGVEAWALHPREVERSDLLAADLVLVDLVLDHWPDRPVQVAASPQNGLALAAVLQGHVSETDDRPTAFALRTARLDLVPSQLPLPTLEHAFARMVNLEWVFPKSREDADDLPGQYRALAEAVASLPDSWDKASGENQLIRLLGLNRQAPWSSLALEDVNSAFPPVHELSATSHGLSFIRWLLHRILPYPCFLLDEPWLAARFGVSTPTLRAFLDRGLYGALEPTLYGGVLETFVGRRWWRAGIESMLWQETDGQSRRPQAVRSFVESHVDGALDADFRPDVVVPLGPDLEPLDEPIPVTEAQLIQPDDWPPYAEPAYTTKVHAEGDLQPLLVFGVSEDARVPEGGTDPG